ncbi:MAG TPA: PQQ-binding-like beta-propeller repeat protein [Streptosporangiaceae bacterium]
MTRIFTAIAVCGALGVSSISVPAAAVAAPQADRGRPAVSLPAVGGAQLWAQRYAGGADLTAGAKAVAVSPAGDKVFVTGESNSGYATIAYQASTGARLWVQRYHGATNWTDTAAAIAVSPTGNAVYVTGTSVGKTPGDYATIAYNARTGARLWVKRYNGPGNSYDTAFAIAVSPNAKTVIVTGGNGGILTDTDYVTIAYSAATGARVWLKRYDGPAGLDDAGISLAVNKAGTTVFVTGTSWSAQTAYDIATIAYRLSDGAQLWLKRYNGPGNGDDTGLSVAVSPSGTSVFVGGESIGATSADDYVTIAYNAATGARQWVTRYNGTGNARDQAHGLAVNPVGTTVYITGHSEGLASGDDCTTVAYNSATGAERWVKRYNGAANGLDAGSAVVVSPSGKVIYVTGTSAGRGTATDYLTIAYNAVTGARIWLKTYDGPAHAADVATAAAVGPSGGRVFVTGRSQGPGAGPDYATIAYNG